MMNISNNILFRHLKKRGIHTFYWVANEEKEFKKCIKHGCTGIMTDSPSKLN